MNLRKVRDDPAPVAITAVLLAAGYATRLYPLTLHCPKALLPLGQGTVLDAVLRGFGEVPQVHRWVLVSNHRFIEPFRQWQRLSGRQVEILDDGTETPDTRLGAIRDVVLAKAAVDLQDDLLVIGTDNLVQWSLADFVRTASAYRPHPSIALGQVASQEAATQCGVVLRDATSRITTFVEKSSNPPSREVALCVYYFPQPMCGELERFLEFGGNADAPGYFIEWLVRRGTVHGIMMPGAWEDIGTPQAYHTVVQTWDEGES